MAKFVTTQLQGGLGNCLFIIATVLGYAKKHNLTPLLPDWKYRNVYSIPESFFSQYEKVYGNYNKTVYSEPHFHHAEIPQFEADIVELQGYFQSYRYFQDVENLVKQFFEPKLHLQVEIDDRYWKIVGTTSEIVVGIHFRLTDYKLYPLHHPITPVTYYIKAVEYFKSKFYKQNVKFLFFSDNMNEVKNIINNSKLRNLCIGNISFHFIEGNDAYEDLYLMSKCDHNIICNSTFSFWGSYLNKNAHKIVTAPEKYKHFGSALKHNKMDDYYMIDWIIID